jgi:hypothetical protein
LNWFWCWVRGRDLVSVFYCGYPNFPAAIVKEVVFSPSCVLSYFVEDQLAVAAWVYVWVFCSSPLVFVSIFFANIMLFLLLQLEYSWSQVLWYLQHWTFCLELFSILEVSCVSICILGLIFLFLWRMSLEFCWILQWTCRLLLVIWPFSQFWLYQSISMGDLSIF